MFKSILNQVYQFEGYCVDNAEVEGGRAVITLRPNLRFTPRCPLCEEAAAVNHTRQNTARDLPLGPHTAG